MKIYIVQIEFRGMPTQKKVMAATPLKAVQAAVDDDRAKAYWATDEAIRISVWASNEAVILNEH